MFRAPPQGHPPLLVAIAAPGDLRLAVEEADIALVRAGTPEDLLAYGRVIDGLSRKKDRQTRLVRLAVISPDISDHNAPPALAADPDNLFVADKLASLVTSGIVDGFSIAWTGDVHRSLALVKRLEPWLRATEPAQARTLRERYGLPRPASPQTTAEHEVFEGTHV